MARLLHLSRPELHETMVTRGRAGGRRRAAMTLVEVLAVCVIIGILASLALPALARAVARSRLTQCTNNQYQIAFALLRHDEQYGYIPGWLNPSVSATSTACSWTVPLLPFLGRSDIYDMWPGLPNKPTIDGFICPSNRPGKSVSYPVVHYAGNAGAGVNNTNDGVFLNLFSGTVSPLSLDAIADADGASTTLAFSEKSASDFVPHTWIFPQAAVGSTVFGSGTSAPPVFGAATPPGPLSPVINALAARAFAPSSTHGGGVVVAFCDGHTAFLSDTLQSYEYGQLLTRKSRWQGTTNITNSTAMQPWLLRSGTAYLLDETILRK